MKQIKTPLLDSSSDSTLSAIRIFTILQALGEQKGNSLAELSLRTMIPKSTVYRFLQTMKFLGYVTQIKNEDKYLLSLRLFELGAKALEYITLNEIACFYMDELSKVLKETVSLGIFDDDYNVHYLHSLDVGHNLYVSPHIGRRLPAFSSALGKAMLAWLEKDKILQLLKVMVFIPFTEKTLRNVDAFIDELVQVREQGYAEDNQETELGLCCLAVPIYDRLGHVIAAISLSLPMIRLQQHAQEQLILLLHQAAAAISEKMGYHSDGKYKKFN